MNELLILSPLILTLILALTLRNTLLALGLGTLFGTLVLNHFTFSSSFNYLSELLIKQFYDKQQWQAWHINIILTMFMLGIMTKMLSQSHAVESFSHWLQLRIKNQRQARIGVIFLGWFVFIDGLFSCLAVGNVCQPLSEKYRISSSRLAYFVDSSASPVTSLIPLSSWGPFVIALLASLSFLQGNPFSNFIDIAQMNFYAIITLLISLYVAWSGIGFDDKNQDITFEHSESEAKGSPWLLIIPILSLLIGSIVLIVWSGYNASNSPHLSDWIVNANIGETMRNASLFSALITFILLIKDKVRASVLFKSSWLGIKTISFAVTILIFTWLIGAIIKELQVAKLLASWSGLYLSKYYLLSGLFGLCALMAFATGSSWGTFAIMIPIGGEIAHIIDPDMLIPALSAVMAGSVFGDHCSPISDTSVLSATSSGCEPFQHVTTQLPFALIGALSAFIGFQLLNFEAPYWLALFAVIMSAYIAIRWCYRPNAAVSFQN
ncbi:sodium:proton antiporter [Shewanella sp. OPT22]|nr:sodium:proton antiporter [Shewanella sp. OPT22]